MAASKDQQPDHAAAVENLMSAVERISTILAHIQGAVPALHSLGAHLSALMGHVTAARAALSPPPKDDAKTDDA